MFQSSLNLIVADTVSTFNNAMDLFVNLERLYDFISSSKFCFDVYENNQIKYYPGQQIHHLKRVSTKRWMSHKFALEVVFKTFKAINKSLNEIRDQSGDKKVDSEAGGFLNYFQSKKLIYTAYCFKSLLEILEPVSSLFQKNDLDLLTASCLIKKKRDEINLQRSEKSFSIILADTEAFINSIKFNFNPLLIGLPKKEKDV